MIRAALADCTQEEFRAAIKAEQRNSQVIANRFVSACEGGDLNDFLYAVDQMALAVDGWRLAMRGIARLPDISPNIQRAFLDIWIGRKMLPRFVGHRPTMAKALRMLMPRSPVESPMRIYRGAAATEHRRRLYGFSWSTSAEVARGFAEHWQKRGPGGVVLETIAPPAAIFIVRQDEGYFDVREVICDPYRLGSITVASNMPKFGPKATRGK